MYVSLINIFYETIVNNILSESFFLRNLFPWKCSVVLRYGTLFQTNTFPTRHVSELQLLIGSPTKYDSMKYDFKILFSDRLIFIRICFQVNTFKTKYIPTNYIITKLMVKVRKSLKFRAIVTSFISLKRQIKANLY